jgi:hypothetical protein
MLQHDPDHIALEMIRKKYLYLRARGGVHGAVLVKKRYGAKCVCWDDGRGLSTDADCPFCYGVGYTGGYLAPTYVPFVHNPGSRNYLAGPGGARYDNSATVFEIPNEPLLAPDDIFIDRVQNTRYKVDRVEPRSHRGYTVAQVVYVTRLDDMSAVYNIPITEPAAIYTGRSFDHLSDTP